MILLSRPPLCLGSSFCMNNHRLLGHFVSLRTSRRPTFSFGFILSFRPAIVEGPRTSPIFNGLHLFLPLSPLFPRWTKSVYSDSRAVQNCFYQLVTRPVSSAPRSIESATLLLQPGSRVKNNRIEPQAPIEIGYHSQKKNCVIFKTLSHAHVLLYMP